MRKHLAVLLAYLILALLLTLPLAVHFASHVPGDGIDDPSLAWNLWWVKFAAVDKPQNPFDCTWQFWPVGVNLAFYTLTILNGLLSVPLQTAFSVISAYNVLLLSSFVLGGFGAYLLALDALRPSRLRDPNARKLHALAAFLAGALYAFASSKLFYASLGQGNIASSQWVPFAALYILRSARPGGRGRDAVLAALFIVLQAYAELTYASFLVIFAMLAFVWGLVDGRRWTDDEPRNQRRSYLPRAPRLPWLRLRPSSFVLRLVARFALLAVLFAVGIAPVLANMVPDLAAEGDFFTSGGGFADLFSADLAGYVVPTQLHPLLGGVVRGWSEWVAAAGEPFPVNKGQQIYVGYVAGALALGGLWRARPRRERWFWAAAALLFFLLTLGPSLRIAGHDTGIPLPFRLMEQLPFFKGNRYPSRYSVMLLVSLVPLVALGAARVGASRLKSQSLLPNLPSQVARTVSEGRLREGGRGFNRRAALPLLLLPLLLFEHLSAPLPLFDLRVPALYDRVAATPGDFALLELPLGWRNGARVAGKQDILIMQQLWYQSAHGKRLLGGNTSRNPEFKFQYFSEDPTLARLIAQTNAADVPQHDALRAELAALPVTAADRTRATDLAAFLNVRYVMVHRDRLPAETETLARALFPLTLVAEDGPLALYEVAGALAQPQVFEPGTDAGRMILAEGWSPAPDAVTGDAVQPPAVIAQRAEARLLLPLPAGPVTLALEGWSFAAGQQVTLIVDGRTLGTQPLAESRSTLAFALPADPRRPALSDVRLRFARTVSLTEWGERRSAAGPAGLLVRSAGEETGNFAHIYVDGVERAPGGRGYNLVALDGDRGTILAAASFDTHADSAASARLAQWVAALPAGTRVAGAVQDEASLNLTAEGVAALRSLGVQGDLRGRFRWSHAFIGRTGPDAAPATEMLDGWQVAEVSDRLPVSSPRIAAAFYRLQVQLQR